MKIQISATKNFIYKVCIVGDGGVGKTSMVLRYTENTFKENYLMTIGSNFSTKSLEFPEYPNYQIKLQIWDLAGQKHFSFVRPPFYRGATAIIYVFDLTRRSSFANLPSWREEVEKVVGEKVSALVGNKLDLASENREISKQEGNSLKDELNAVGYYETSAKEGIKIDIVFEDVVKAILKASNKI
ncbi:MAG: GTP-binding protein [Candidatus Lokiarchaeota archaeon]|nr:GTP-binding protein [Candidatus Lokiarchaeota archaeon]